MNFTEEVQKLIDEAVAAAKLEARKAGYNDGYVACLKKVKDVSEQYTVFCEKDKPAAANKSVFMFDGFGFAAGSVVIRVSHPSGVIDRYRFNGSEWVREWVRE